MVTRNLILRWVAPLVWVAVCLAWASPALAITQQNVTQGYQSAQNLQYGMIVRLKPGDAGSVEALTSKEPKDMLGVIVPPGESTVSLSTQGPGQEVYVATNGKYNVLVSTQNGPIKEGDYITISSIAGVGMKAESAQPVIVGRTLKGFAGTTDSEGSATLQTAIGQKKISLGRVLIDISVGRNPLYSKRFEAGVPTALSRAAQIVTDQPVSAFRIYAGLAILSLTALISGSVLFVGVRTSMWAIGRNPLAKHAIFRNLVQVLLVALIVFTIGIIAVYLLLKV